VTKATGDIEGVVDADGEFTRDWVPTMEIEI
jgi:hypothetical protein